ncbi:MAG: hypothetical protein V1934_00505 [Methanobacteriota archaeon]
MKQNQKTIEVYIKSKAVTSTVLSCLPSCSKVVSITYVLNEEEMHLKELVESIGKNYGIDVVLHDLGLKSEGRQAWFKGIKRTPLLVINGHKIEKIPDNEQELVAILSKV